MIFINDMGMQCGTKLLFHSVNLNLNKGQRFGIVGANGVGKSTLLKLLSNQESQTFGTIEISKNSTIGSLQQDQFKYQDELIVNVVLRGKEQLWDANLEKEEIFKKPDITEKDGYRLAELEEIVIHNNGYETEILAEKLLIGLGINANKHYEPLSVLSGGYKLRVLLAQALFKNPDILLLDEPTNHLDIMTSKWLEEYLVNEFKGLLLLVSHDIYFLDQVSTDILDIDYGEIRQYPGSYYNFVKAKDLYIEQKLKEKKTF